MKIIFDTPQEAEVFKTEVFKLQTNIAKSQIKPQEGSVLFIEQLYYLASDPSYHPEPAEPLKHS